MTHHFELEMAGFGCSGGFWRQIGLEPARRDPATGCKPEERQLYQIPHNRCPVAMNING
jgi:hypothetical protein